MQRSGGVQRSCTSVGAVLEIASRFGNLMEVLFRIWSSNWSLTFVGHPRDLEFVSSISIASAERERLSSFIRVIRRISSRKKKHKKKKSRRAVHDSVYQGNIFQIVLAFLLSSTRSDEFVHDSVDQRLLVWRI